MNIKTAIFKAKIIQEVHPDWILCGSVGMILAGIIPERDIHDLDFFTETYDFYNMQKRKSVTHSQPAVHRQKLDKIFRSYTYYNIGFPESCCVFLFPKSYKFSLEPRGYTNKLFHKAGLKIQCKEEMIFWKEHFARDKDILDLASVC